MSAPVVGEAPQPQPRPHLATPALPGILGVAGYRPDRRVGNDELVGSLATTDEWIRTRTGIESRYLAGDAESVVTMGAEAARKCLATAGVDASEVDLVVLATCTIREAIPGGAARLAGLAGARGAPAFDVNAACSGFPYALTLAGSAVRSGLARHPLVVASEKLSDWVDWTDRSTAVLFGDGAAAVVLGPADLDGVGPVVWGSEPEGHDLVSVPAGARTIAMNGPALYRWITGRLPAVAEEACTRAGIEVGELAAFVPHQANLRIVEALARSLRLPPSVVVARDVVQSGNTSAASIPLALARLVETRAVAPGDPVLLVSVGAGLSYAAQVVRSP